MTEDEIGRIADALEERLTDRIAASVEKRLSPRLDALTDLVQAMATGHARRFCAIERDIADIKQRLPLPPASETDPLRAV